MRYLSYRAFLPLCLRVGGISFDGMDAGAYYTSMRETVSNKVHALRMKRELTQEALAQCVGVSRQTIIAIEKEIIYRRYCLHLPLLGFSKFL